MKNVETTNIFSKMLYLDCIWFSDQLADCFIIFRIILRLLMFICLLVLSGFTLEGLVDFVEILLGLLEISLFFAMDIIFEECVDLLLENPLLKTVLELLKSILHFLILLQINKALWYFKFTLEPMLCGIVDNWV